MKSYMPSATTLERKWYVVDAEGKTLGRLASEVAMVLRGKKKPIFTPFIDCGDYVIIVNADKFKVTGHKMHDKTYFSHSDYVGGANTVSLEVLMEKHPTKAVEHAVRGMLPKGALGNQMFKKLFVYAGPEHKHEAQKPEKLEF